MKKTLWFKKKKKNSIRPLPKSEYTWKIIVEILNYTAIVKVFFSIMDNYLNDWSI